MVEHLSRPQRRVGKQAKLEKERYRKEMAAWELMKARSQQEEVIDLVDDDDTASRSDDLQMTMTPSSNQGSVWRGGGMVYSNASFQQWLTSAGFNPSFALNHASLMASNYVRSISTDNPASSSGVLPGPIVSSVHLPFIVEANPQHGWAVPQGSLLSYGNTPSQPFQFDGRMESMPDSFQCERDNQMASFGFDTARQQNRRASLFSSAREIGPGILLESNDRPIPIGEIKRFFDSNPKATARPTEEIPIEEIKRFFNINPETNQIERQN
jgi:hypothetical protein